MKIELAKSEVIHFVGIGGIGMSGLSMIMKRKGFKVQGSDISNNKNINRIRKEKIKVYVGHKKQNISKATILVVSSAIKQNNPELIEAKSKGLPISLPHKFKLGCIKLCQSSYNNGILSQSQLLPQLNFVLSISFSV